MGSAFLGCHLNLQTTANGSSTDVGEPDLGDAGENSTDVLAAGVGSLFAGGSGKVKPAVFGGGGCIMGPVERGLGTGLREPLDGFGRVSMRPWYI